MAWVVLIAAGVLEIGWPVGLKTSAGFTRPVPSLPTAATIAARLGLLGLAMRTLPVGAAILGILLFGAAASAARLCLPEPARGGHLGLTLVTPG
jgi:quaternary ammonium compound-resistance protein SugE